MKLASDSSVWFHNPPFFTSFGGDMRGGKIGSVTESSLFGDGYRPEILEQYSMLT